MILKAFNTWASRQLFIDEHDEPFKRRGFDVYTARHTEIDDTGTSMITSNQIFYNMTIGKWSFGIGLECVAVIKYGSTWDTDGSTRQPLVIPPPSDRRELHSHCHREIYLQSHMPAIRNQVQKVLVNNLRTAPVLAGAQAITKASQQRFKHRIDPLADYLEWQVKNNSIRLPDSLLREHINCFLAPIEITSPALVVSMNNFHLIQEACDVLENEFELLTPKATGLRIHVGQGRDWIPLHNLRRIAGLCYPADGLLAQLHPEHRRDNGECASNRLYSLLSRGVTARMLETTYGWHEGVEIPPSSAGAKKDEPKDYSCIDRLAIPHGSLRGYTQNLEILVKCPIPADLLEAYPNLGNNQELLSIKAAVGELLSCIDVRTVGRLMMCDPNRLVPAYKFSQYTSEMYRLPNVKRTIEFRQATGDLESSAAVWARVFTWLCEWACEVDLETYWDVILRCSAAQENGVTDPGYDALDLLVDLGLHAEAQFLQSDHLYREAKKAVPPNPSLPKLDRPYRRLPSCTGGTNE